MSESIEERLARVKAERLAAEAAAAPPPPPEHDPDLIPDPGPSSTYVRTMEDDEVDRIVNEIDILDAYNRYVGGEIEKIGGRREGIHIQCPNPYHDDGHPSAYVNLDEQVWACPVCKNPANPSKWDGGDVLELIARAKGITDASYKLGKNFPEFKREVAEETGRIVIQRDSRGKSQIIPVVQEEQDESEVCDSQTEPLSGLPPTNPVTSGTVDEDPAPSGVGLATVTSLHGDLSPEDASGQAQVAAAIPVIPWEEIFPKDTFIHEYVSRTDSDDLPTPYHIFNGFILVGLALGKRVLFNDSPPVYGNLFVCHYGPSGMGKSKSHIPMMKVLREALPFDRSDPDNKGVMIASSPGSPEAMIDSYYWPIYDPADIKKVIGSNSVVGLNREGELSNFVGRSNRSGNPMKPTFMDFYDAQHSVTTKSRGGGEVIATDPFCSMVTTTQPRAIRTVLLANDVDSGFVNRFIFVMGASKRTIPWNPGDPDLTNAVTLLKKIRANSLLSTAAAIKVDMTPEAENAWNEFHWSEMEKFKEMDDSIMSRIPLTMKKLLFLIAMNETAKEVTEDHIKKVILLFPYIQATYAYLSGDLGTGERQEYDRAVMDAIEAHKTATGRGATPTDIVKRLAKRYDRSAGTVRRSLEDLAAVGLIEPTAVKSTNGRQMTRYEVAS